MLVKVNKELQLQAKSYSFKTYLKAFTKLLPLSVVVLTILLAIP